MLSLDEIVFRTALARARRLMRRGKVAEEAAENACTRTWAAHRERVLNALLAEWMTDDQE